MAWTRTTVAGVAAAALTMAVAGLSAQEPPAAGGGAKPDHVAALKQSLQEGQAKIRQYEWVETTILSLKGEEKSRKQNRCYYGTDGKVQKVPVAEAPAGAAPAPSDGRRRRGAGKVKENIVENKKEEMQEYMQRAVKLIHGYVPPTPAQIQAAKDTGRVTVDQQAGGKVRVVIAHYLQPGGLADDRSGRRGQPPAWPRHQQLSRQARRQGHAGGADGHAAGRRVLSRPDDAGRACQEHQGG
jgi:hypothetical protein